MYSCGPPHMDVQKQDDQHELTYSNYVRTQDVNMKTRRRRSMIGRSGERGSGISVLAARHDDDDDDDMDANLLYEEKAWQQLHKNAASNIEQVLQQHPTKQRLYGHLPPITKTIKTRRKRHAGHCWRSRDELISDVHLWTLSHGRAKAGRLALKLYTAALCRYSM